MECRWRNAEGAKDRRRHGWPLERTGMEAKGKGEASRGRGRSQRVLGGKMDGHREIEGRRGGDRWDTNLLDGLAPIQFEP